MLAKIQKKLSVIKNIPYVCKQNIQRRSKEKWIAQGKYRAVYVRPLRKV
jgi:hypothetical protein